MVMSAWDVVSSIWSLFLGFIGGLLSLNIPGYNISMKSFFIFFWLLAIIGWALRQMYGSGGDKKSKGGK